MNQPDKKNKTIQSVTGIVVGIIVMVLVQQVFFSKPSFDKIMMEAASEINKSCPLMLDQDTRLDNTMALPGNVFQYNYTLVNMEKETVDEVDLKNYLESNIVNNIKTNPDLKPYRDNKVTMSYVYRDKDGHFLIKIEATPDKYGE